MIMCCSPIWSSRKITLNYFPSVFASEKYANFTKQIWRSSTNSPKSNKKATEKLLLKDSSLSLWYNITIWIGLTKFWKIKCSNWKTKSKNWRLRSAPRHWKLEDLRRSQAKFTCFKGRMILWQKRSSIWKKNYSSHLRDVIPRALASTIPLSNPGKETYRKTEWLWTWK